MATLAPYLQEKDHEVKLFSYGWVGLMGAWFLNPRIVDVFIKLVEPGDCAVGHSNGCVIIHMAAIYGAPLHKVSYLSPALKRDLPPAAHVDKVSILHTQNDSAVKFGRWLRLLAPWAPLGDPIWGDMGAIGYGPDTGRDKDYPQYRYERIVFSLERLAVRNRFFRLLLRVIVGIPVALFLWLFMGPIEIFAGFVLNNILNPSRPASLDLRFVEDRRYLFFAGLIPALFWAGLFYFVGF